MSSDNSTVPAAPPDDHYVDGINLVSSTTIAATAYGIMATLYFICCYFLGKQMANREEKRRSIFLLSYISILFIMGSVYTGTTTNATMVSYVDHAAFPGGPSYYNNMVLFSAPVGIINTVSYTVANWMSDALLLWRLLILYRTTPYKWFITTFPALIFLGSVAMGFMFIIQTSFPMASLWANGEMQFALPYFVLSVSMSIISTILMLVRMLLVKRQMQSVLGHYYDSPFTSVTAILVESCVLYGVFSIIFIVLYALNHPIQYVFLSALANVQIISPLLIIFRVSQNKAWNQSTEQTLSNLRFGDNSKPEHSKNAIKLNKFIISKVQTESSLSTAAA